MCRPSFNHTPNLTLSAVEDVLLAKIKLDFWNHKHCELGRDLINHLNAGKNSRTLEKKDKIATNEQWIDIVFSVAIREVFVKKL